MSRTPWDAVLFDLDGTLANTLPLILACYREMMMEHFGRPGDPDAWRRKVGRPLPVMLREISRDDAEAMELRRIYKRVQHDLHDRMVTAFEGIPEVVQREVDRGRPRAIVTSKGAPMTERTMAVCGLTGTFPVIVTADHVERPKPDPQPVYIALEHLGVEPSRRVIFVGDSVHDMEAGRAAGVTTLGVTWGAVGRERLEAAHPDYIVDRVEDLGAILDEGQEERGAA